MWFLVMEYVVFILNRLSLPSLDNATPLSCLTGQRPDISMIPVYAFWDEVYYAHYARSQTEAIVRTSQALGRFIGFSEHVGHQMTYKIYCFHTGHVAVRSQLRLATDGERNKCADALPDLATGEEDYSPAEVAALLNFDSLRGGTPHTHKMTTRSKTHADELARRHRPLPGDPPDVSTDPTDKDGEIAGDTNINAEPEPDELILQSLHDARINESHPLFIVNPEEELIGRSFRLPEKPDGSSGLAFIHKVIEEHEGALMRNPDLVKFKYTISDEVIDDLFSYNKALEYMTASDMIEEPEWNASTTGSPGSRK
jgi:hypothetical protein